MNGNDEYGERTHQFTDLTCQSCYLQFRKHEELDDGEMVRFPRCETLVVA